jgi:predicted TIM-barrel fold metal-dependent hydrolase
MSMKRPVTGVDLHTHALKLNHPLASHRPRQGHHQPLRDATAAQLVQLMDAHGISHAVVVAPSFYGVDNSLVLEAVAAYPDRLVCTVIVDPTILDVELERLRSAGARGFRLHIYRRKTLPDIAGRNYQRLFAMLRDLNMHIEVVLEGDILPSVAPALFASGAKVVFDHFGIPNPVKGIHGDGFACVLDAVARGDAWVKLSAPFLLGGHDPRPYVNALIANGGPEHLLWGSDWPWVSREDSHSYGECLHWLHQWIDDPQLRHKVLVANPSRLLGL